MFGMRISLLASIALLTIAVHAHSQDVVAAPAAHTQPDLPKISMVDVVVKSGIYTYTGRGVVLSPTLVATAEHVIEADGTYHLPLVRFSDKREAKATAIVKRWPERDLAIIKLSVPDGIPATPLVGADEPDSVWSFDFQGRKREYRNLRIQNKGSLYFDYTPRMGESGGPVFTPDGALVGIVSGGFFWLEDRPQHTWPLRVGRADVLREFLK